MKSLEEGGRYTLLSLEKLSSHYDSGETSEDSASYFLLYVTGLKCTVSLFLCAVSCREHPFLRFALNWELESLLV